VSHSEGSEAAPKQLIDIVKSQQTCTWQQMLCAMARRWWTSRCRLHCNLTIQGCVCWYVQQREVKRTAAKVKDLAGSNHSAACPEGCARGRSLPAEMLAAVRMCPTAV
jgi:hypothetical protein